MPADFLVFHHKFKLIKGSEKSVHEICGLIISDGMGHRVRLITPVSLDMALPQVKATHEHYTQSMGKADRVITGVALIFGLGGFLAWWQNYKKNGKTQG